mgnify:CR=1 FL=1
MPPETKPPPLQLHHNMFWGVFGTLVNAAAQWGVLVTLAKLGSSDAVGQYTLALAITAPLIAFTNLNLRHVVASDVADTLEFGTYLSTRLATSAVAILATLVIVKLIAAYPSPTNWVILVIAAAKTIEAVSDLIYGLLQRYERLDYVARSMALAGPLALLAIAGGLWLTDNLVVGVIGLASLWLCRMIVFDIPTAARFAAVRVQFRGQAILRLVRRTLPLGAGKALVSLEATVPHYFVAYYVGLEHLGYFAAFTYLLQPGIVAMNSISHAIIPRFAAAYQNGEQAAARTLLMRALLISVPAVTITLTFVCTFSDTLLPLVYTSSHTLYADVLVLLAVAAGIHCATSFLTSSVTAAGAFAGQMPISLLTLAASIGTSLLLVPSHGIRGAAVAAIASAATQFLGFATLQLLCWRTRASTPSPS